MCTPRRTKRGNGQGSVYKTPGGRWKAVVVLGYYSTPDGKLRRHTRSQVFDRKRDAIAALPSLRVSPKQRRRELMTFWQVFDAWIQTHSAGKSTLDCYRAAVRYFGPLFTLPFSEIDVDDLQECVDACPHGRRTRENMKTVAGLMYKYAVPRHLSFDGLNLGQYLRVSGEGAARREAFSADQIERISRMAGIVDGADAILMMIYTGFRPSEFLALAASDYDKASRCITGGAKTEAGKGRKVSVSPKILSLVERRAAGSGPLYPDENGEYRTLRRFYDDCFYPALEACGIDNPVVEIAGGVQRRKFTPHSCRHTFATLLKRVPGAEKDKLELMGHSSGEMLRYYQDVSAEDLRRLTDAI